MLKITNACIFDFSKIGWHIDQIKERLVNVPIIDKQGNAIGHVERATSHIRPFFYGDIILYKSDNPNLRFFKNYEIIEDKILSVTLHTCANDKPVEITF